MSRRTSKIGKKESMTNSAQTKSCRHCAQTIAKKASTCHWCGKHQTVIWSFLDRAGVIGSIAGAIVSIALAVLAFLQFSEARQERIKAQKAFEKANEACIEAQKAAGEAKITAENLQKQILSVSKITYLQVVTRNDFTPERAGKAIGEIMKELNTVTLPLAIPDYQSRAKWIQNVCEFMPPDRPTEKKSAQ